MAAVFFNRCIKKEMNHEFYQNLNTESATKLSETKITAQKRINKRMSKYKNKYKGDTDGQTWKGLKQGLQSWFLNLRVSLAVFQSLL